jgi:hypothetical protein
MTSSLRRVPKIWLDLPGAEYLPAEAMDILMPWLSDDGPPPGEPTETDEPPLRSDDTPPAVHPGIPIEVAPNCPRLRFLVRDAPGCGGLPGEVAERAFAYQLASIRDPKDWDVFTKGDPVRAMRQSSAMSIFRILAHYAHPEQSWDRSINRNQLLSEWLGLNPGQEPSDLQKWHEAADFGANGLLRLLFLYGHMSWAPDSNQPNVLEPLIPCDLQWAAVNQLLGFKYFGDEIARHPDPKNSEVYWSENHQLLFATAEYLAGQLLADHVFQPTVYVKNGEAWEAVTDPAWKISADERMARAYRRLVRWFDHRLMFGLAEWTSPVYFDYDIAALLNLVDFCDDSAVADKAAMVMDILLLELARFAGHGQGVGTAGRAYPSHKYTGWGASLCDTLQILFGHWEVDPKAEELLETWRLQNVFEIWQENLAAVTGEAEEAADDQELEGGERVMFIANMVEDWKLANPIDQARHAVPAFHTWSVADCVGAHSLATSKRYCIPTAIFGYASTPGQQGRFERSRVSIEFEEGQQQYGIDFTGQANVLDWWARGGFGAPQTIVGSRDLAADWRMESVSPFSEIPGLFFLPDLALVEASKLLAVESLGSCLTTANLALWREPGVSLSSAQKFRFGQVGRQAQIWQATLGPYVTVWSTYPAAESSEKDNDGPSWWSGNASQPRVVQMEDALICIHDSTLLSYTNFTYGHRSHAWFPVDMFHEAQEVRPDPDDDDRSIRMDLHTGRVWTDPLGVNAERGGVWWFGRRDKAYTGLFSAKDGCTLLRGGRWANREILCEDRVNVFICQVGSEGRFGSFQQFITACVAARIHVGMGVYQPSNPFVDIQCSYDVPGKRRLSINLEDRYPSWHGSKFSDERFPRWETPWCRVLWGQRQYAIRSEDQYGTPLALTHDCVNGFRSGDGL